MTLLQLRRAIQCIRPEYDDATVYIDQHQPSTIARAVFVFVAPESPSEGQSSVWITDDMSPPGGLSPALIIVPGAIIA